MTKNEAIEAMKTGAKVTHRFFEQNEWISMRGNFTIIFEDGCSLSADEFWKYRDSAQWETDWSIWIEQK